MPSPTLNHTIFERIQESLSLDTFGIIWLSQDNLSQREVPFSDMDYFFDGALTQRLIQASASKSLKESSTLVVGNHFGSPFFLTQAKKDISELNKILEGPINIMKAKSGQRNKILVIAANNNDLPSSITKKFSTINFEFLQIS